MCKLWQNSRQNWHIINFLSWLVNLKLYFVFFKTSPLFIICCSPVSRPWGCPGGCRWWWRGWWSARPRWSAGPATQRPWPRRWGLRTPGPASPPGMWPAPAPGHRMVTPETIRQCYQLTTFEDTVNRNEALVIQAHHCCQYIYCLLNLLPFAWFQFSNGRGLVLNWLSKTHPSLLCTFHVSPAPGTGDSGPAGHYAAQAEWRNWFDYTLTLPRKHLNQQISANSIVMRELMRRCCDNIMIMSTCHMHQMLEYIKKKKIFNNSTQTRISKCPCFYVGI